MSDVLILAGMCFLAMVAYGYYRKVKYGPVILKVRVLDYVDALEIPSREARKPGKPHYASKSEIKRWCDSSVVMINGRPRGWREQVKFPVNSLVFFPKGKRITIF